MRAARDTRGWMGAAFASVLIAGVAQSSGLPPALTRGRPSGPFSAAPAALRPQASDPADRESLRTAIAQLAAPAEAERNAALELLTSAGELAAQVALEGFADSAPDERRLRAFVVREMGAGAALDSALPYVRDADPHVRRSILRLLGRGELTTRVESRVRALEEAARDDTNAEVRETAREGLARIAGPEPVAALGRLVFELPSAEAARAAEILAGLPRARDRVRQLVQGAFADDGAALADEVLAPLLVGYGRALAETAGGGLSAQDQAPFVLGARHPAGIVRLGSLRGWNALLARNQDLDQDARSIELLSGLAGNGMGAAEVHFRRAYVALADAGDPATARESARALVRGVASGAALDERMFLFYGRYFEACADLAERNAESALLGFERAGEILDGIRAERVELRPHLARPSELHAAVAVDQAVFRSLVEIGGVMSRLAAGAAPGDRAVLEDARRAHVFALEAQLIGTSTNAPVAVGDWDSILDDNLALRRLVFAGGRAPGFSPVDSLALLVDTYRALAGVAPLELPGFEPARLRASGAGDAEFERAAAELASPFDDPPRLELLTDLLIAERGRIERRLVELLDRRSPDYIEDPIGLEQRRLHLRARQLDDQLAQVEDGDLEPLRTLRLPSDEVTVVAREQLALGESQAALELAQRALDDIEAARIWETYYFKPSFAARLEVLLGSAHMDRGESDEAERAYQRALARHEGLENLYTQRMREAGESGAAPFRNQIARIRLDRSNVLVSLAVNANVRQLDPEKALGYFEQAYELQKNDFMRVLLACYRARSGRFEEARAELRQVPVSPGQYYNLACTYALMGEADTALDYLAREFAENHPDEASAKRQRGWAAGDPDLASLREDPRFQRMVE